MAKKTTKRALLLSVLSMMLCVAMLVGSTFAWFTDSVTSGMNTIVAGNLDVELYHTNARITDTAMDEEKKVDGNTTLFVSADENFQWEPGAMLYENFTVKNAGSLALKYRLMLKAECNATEDGVSLENVLKVAVLDKAFSGERAEAMKQDFEMTVAQFVKSGAEIASGKLLNKGDAENCAIIIYWEPTDNDDLYNFNNGNAEKLYIDLGVNLVATQAVSESDSFSEDYDKYATYPIVADVHYEASTTADFLAALNNMQDGKTTAIHLKEDIDLNEVGNPEDYWKYHYKISGDKDAIIDLGGNEITFAVDKTSNFTGGILADKVGITVLNGTVNVESGTGFYTTGTATSTFENVKFNVASGYGVQGVGYTEFTNCTFDIGSAYGIFCSKSTTVKGCSFAVEGFNGNGIYMNNHCNGNVITDCTFEIKNGAAIYVNGTSDAEISNVDITLTGSKDVSGIYVSADSNVTLGENISIKNSSTYYSSNLISGALNLVNIAYADGVASETDGTYSDSTAGFAKRTYIKNGTYWKTVATRAAVTFTSEELSGLTGGNPYRETFEINGVSFIAEAYKSSLAPEAPEFSITVTELAESQSGAFAITFNDGVTKYYKIELSGLNSDEDADSPNLYVKGATAGEQIDMGTVSWSGYGYETTIKGYEGKYFMLGGLCIEE